MTGPGYGTFRPGSYERHEDPDGITDHRWEVVSVDVEGHGSLSSGVRQVCATCGAVRFDPRPREGDDA